MMGRDGSHLKRKKGQPSFLFVGNHPCLDFINTQIVVRGKPVDLLGGFEDLLAWLVQAKCIDTTQGKEAMMYWDRAEQERLFGEAMTFRQTLRRMTEHIVAGEQIPASTVTAINRVFLQCLGYSQVTHVDGHFERGFHFQDEQTPRLLIPLAEAASDLLCSCDRSLIKKCRNISCVLYFYDTTKNHARNWCSMQLCGNRMKVAAHYRKKRKLRKPPIAETRR